MGAKGTKLNKESRAKISMAMKRRFENNHAQLMLSIKGNRVYIRALGNNAVSVEIDVTPIWHFFKETMKFAEKKKHKQLSK